MYKKKIYDLLIIKKKHKKKKLYQKQTIYSFKAKTPFKGDFLDLGGESIKSSS